MRPRCFALFLIAAGLACEKPEPSEQTGVAEKPPTPVEAVRVGKGAVSRRIRGSGVARGIREASVVSETQGTIRKVAFGLGQWIEKGQLLVLVDRRVQEASLAQARDAAEAAELNVKVVEKLYNEGSASEAEYKNARAQLTSARARLASARKALDDCSIAAPISGYVAAREATIEEGNYLAMGAPVGRIVNLNALETTIPVGEMEVGYLSPGQPAVVEIPAVGDTVFAGKVRAVAAGADRSTGSYMVEIRWSNAPDRKVKSGMSVQVTIETEVSDSAVLLPSRAVIEKESKGAVFVAENGKAALRFISLGRSIDNEVEVIGGVQVGDMLITSGMTNLARGDSVVVTLTGGEGGAGQ